MTYAEALTYFKHRIDFGQCGKETAQRFAFEEAIKALEKQIPKTEFCDMGQGWSCPTCGALTGRHFAYCPECGQRLE